MTDELPLATANGRLPFGSQAPVGATDTMMHIFCFVAPVGAFEYKVLRPRVVTLGNTSTVPLGRIRNKTKICLQQNSPQYCGFRTAQALPSVLRTSDCKFYIAFYQLAFFECRILFAFFHREWSDFCLLVRSRVQGGWWDLIS